MGNNSKMKKGSLNRSKRKAITMSYKKLNLSRSNTSLSQLISLGAYKRRINDLVKNNRLLAVALQEARLENTYQNNMLKEFARCSNQMKIFKFKVNEMVKTTITKLVSDVNELVKSLDDDWSIDDYNFLHNKGPHDRMKIRGPTVECVEEEGSVLSSENEEAETVSNEIQSEETHVGREEQEMVPAVSDFQADSAAIHDMPPILYIDDTEGNSEQNRKKKSSRKSKSRSSSRKRITENHLSLTPELDIDIDFLSQRQNSSRRQTQIFTPVRSLGRSRKMSSLGQTFLEHETPKNSLIRRESIPQRKLSPVLIDCDQNSNNGEELEAMNVNTKTRGSKNDNLSDLQLSSVNTDDNSAHINIPDIASAVCLGKIIPKNVANNDCTLANQTILMNEDMELTDVIRPVAEIDIGSIPPDIVKVPPSSSDNQLRVRNKAEKLNLEPEDKCNDSKLLAYSEDTEVIQLDKYLNIVEKGNRDSISKVMPPCKPSEPSENAIPMEESPSESPLQRRSSRKRKKIITLEFSSSDSESDFTPMNSDTSKKKKIQRDTVIYKPPKKSPGVLASAETAKKNSLANKEVHKISPSALSVYDLDVSNSKKPIKKSRPRNKTKGSLTKEIAKPISQKCSITKLKGAECKFSKNENFDVKNQENRQSEISKQQETKNVQNNAAKETPPIFTFNLNEIVAENEKSIRASRDEISSPKVADSKEITFKSPGTRRVSFASTDVVCNFTKMSVPKTIIQNKKVHRISKSNFDTIDFNFGDIASDFETENTNLSEKSCISATSNKRGSLELKLHKESRITLTKSALHTLDENFIATDPLALDVGLNAPKACLSSEAPKILSYIIDRNVDSTPNLEVTILQEDPQHLVSHKTTDSPGSTCQKISNKKSEKCILVKTNDNKVLKTLEENSTIQKKVPSHDSNHRREKANSELIKKCLNTRKGISAHSSNIIIKDTNSSSSPKNLLFLKKAQKLSSAALNENPDSKSIKKNLSIPKNAQPCDGLGNIIESRDITTTQAEIHAPRTSNVVKESDSESLKEESEVQKKEKLLALDNITQNLNSKSLKVTEEKEATDASKRNKQSRKKAPQPISGKIYEDISTLSKCSNPSFQSTNNNSNKGMTQNDYKENVLNDHHILDKDQTDPRVKTKKSQQKNLPLTDNFQKELPEDKNVKDLAQTVHKRGISSLESCHPSSYKKSSNLRLSVESSPVLKDVMNLEENANKRGSSRRAKVAVSYKEQKLNVKMRRE